MCNSQGTLGYTETYSLKSLFYLHSEENRRPLAKKSNKNVLYVSGEYFVYINQFKFYGVFLNEQDQNSN